MLKKIRRFTRKMGAARLEKFEEQYAGAEWDFLAGLPELARYSLIVGYCDFLGAARVLDIGCGTGLLAKRLRRPPVQAYVGVDFSPAAIEQALADAPIPGDVFEVADAARYEPAGTFDVIVFNELLYYFRDPSPVVARYARFLRPGGAFVVSIHSTEKKNWIWEDIGQRFDVVDGVTVAHGAGESWSVRLVRPR